MREAWHRLLNWLRPYPDDAEMQAAMLKRVRERHIRSMPRNGFVLSGLTHMQALDQMFGPASIGVDWDGNITITPLRTVDRIKWKWRKP